MQLPDSKNAKVDLTPDGTFTFSASAGAADNQYELKLELFDKVNVEVRRLSQFMGIFDIFNNVYFLLSLFFLFPSNASNNHMA